MVPWLEQDPYLRQPLALPPTSQQPIYDIACANSHPRSLTIG